MDHIVAGTDRLTNTIRLGTHYSMMLNSRDDITQIITNIGKQKEIENIQIFNKSGQIKYSNIQSHLNNNTNIEACYICHKTEPPLSELSLGERTRIFHSPKGYRLLGIISPIYNEPGCSTGCHVHPGDKKILGALDVVVSLEETDKEILFFEKGIIGLAVFIFLCTSILIFVFVLRFVNRPVKKLIEGTHLIAKGEYDREVVIPQKDEMGQLADAINKMGREIGEKQAELNKQKDEYQNLFELVPCLITIQDKNLRLIRYNHQFSDRFNPVPGDYCFHAYKGRDLKCESCPVERTFIDGKPHYGEESRINADGSTTHWVARTSPVRNDKNEITAVMEVCLDITERKKLEENLEKSEKKYYSIFNNMPNPVFVLDMDTLNILDCNGSVTTVYGFMKDEIINKSFMDLFKEDEKEKYGFRMRVYSVLNQVKHVRKDGKTIFVNIRVSPSEYPGQKVLLVTTSDITKRLEVEQQLIQASKMATLGEMATGVAHELNQPLSVIKTVSSFFIQKIGKNETIGEPILNNMLEKVDSNVDRATRIINHLREFARKSEANFVKIRVSEVMGKAFEIFSQQLKVRGIEVSWDIEKDLPMIMADPGRLEQVFINLLINARDAIEEKWKFKEDVKSEKKITLRAFKEKNSITVEICDTGIGIHKTILEKIFEPFFTTKEVGKGTGLGLSISYGIVKDCGGTIKAVSEEGRGACFVITFPIKDTEDGKADSSG
jgi:histidine kinase